LRRAIGGLTRAGWQADARVAFFFDGINMTAQKNKQKLFLTMLLDGPHECVVSQHIAGAR